MKKWIAGTCCMFALACRPAEADQVVSDDLIVQGSLCVGFDCVNGESFGFDTIRLKENNTRIRFEDTSVGTFPSNDWQIFANDSASGGASYLGIEDNTAGRMIFRVDAGAPLLSLRIDALGNLNLTSTTARITNVADPVSGTDAVNLQTLNTALATTPTPTWMASSSTDAAQVSGSGATAVGAGSSAGTNDTAIGYRATVTADNSVAVGAYSQVRSPDSVAVGANATVEEGAEGGTALGQNARVSSGATNSVALGSDSVATEPNTVSVGAPGNERRITNVAAGIRSTDAANVGQLNQVSARVSTNARNIAINRQNIARNPAAIEENRIDIAELQDEMSDAHGGIAAAASLIVLSPSAPGRTTFNAGVANFQSEPALGLTLAHRLDSAVLGDSFYLNCGFAVSDGGTLQRIGGSWEF